MYIGLDIGGTSIKAVLTDAKGNVFNSKSVPTASDSAAIIDDITVLIENICFEKDIKLSKIKAIGAGIAGAVDASAGKIIMSPNIHCLDKFNFSKKLEEKLNKPVFIENDAAVALLGEWWLGNGNKYNDWIMLTLGTGIGGGAVVNGTLLSGRDGFAAEFGHIILDYNGNQCGCGSQGCFETYASATALVNIAAKKLKKEKKGSAYKRSIREAVTSKMIYEEAIKGDPVSLEIFDEVGFYLGLGISSLINTFNPEAVIIGGGLSRAKKLLLPKVKEVVKERAMKGLNERIKYHTVKHENKGPALGAIKNAMDKLG